MLAASIAKLHIEQADDKPADHQDGGHHARQENNAVKHHQQKGKRNADNREGGEDTD
ncbi:MAG: hypothetical protein HUJ16_00645 [Kangiella sp.]|nr:hypothetical protein [Kangiella sp.]